MLGGYFLPFLEEFLELEVETEGFCVDLVQSWKEVFAQVFVVFVQGFQSQDTRDYQEDICVRTLDHLLEFLVLLGHRLDCT